MKTARRIWRRVVPRAIRRAVRPPVGGERAARPAPRRAPESRPGPGRPNGLNRLHVGCGPTNLLADWWNVDIRQFTGVDQVADVTKPWPWHDLDYVYGEHFLEHITLDEAVEFLAEAAKALRPGGRIRLSTPGLELIWQTHFEPTWAADEAIAGTYRVNRSFHGWGHRFIYSRPLLEHVLRSTGFTDITFHRTGESDDPALRDLERHPGYEVVDDWPSVWIVEASPAGTDTLPAIREEAEREIERYRRSGH